MKTKKPDVKRAKKHLERLYKLADQGNSPFEGMTKEEVIKRLRKTREEIWEEKLAFRHNLPPYITTFLTKETP